jgi:hypothetical protein
MAYLMLRQSCSYDDAFSKVQSARAICNPNTAFICQMLEWYRRLNEPLDKSRAFRVARHASQPDSPYCARAVAAGAPPPKRDECVVIHTPTRVFLWRGSSADAATLAEGELFVKRLQEKEGAPQSCELVDAGNEPAGFWNAATACGFSIPHNAAGSPLKIAELPVDSERDTRLAAEDEAMRAGNRHYATQQHAAPPPTQRSEPTAFELIKMKQLQGEANGTIQMEPMSRRERREDEYVTTAPVAKEDNEDEGKLFMYPDWEELEMFDSDDLASDIAVVLLPNKKPVECVYVWTGEEFIENEGTIGPEIAGEFLATQGLPSTTEVKLEVEADESDAFWDFFVNG